MKIIHHFPYGRNQPGRETAKNLGILPFTYGIFLTTSNFLTWSGMAICINKLEASENMQSFEHRTCAIKRQLIAVFRDESAIRQSGASSLNTTENDNSTVFLLLYYCLLQSAVYCLLSDIFCLPSTINFLSTVSCLLFTINCLLFSILWTVFCEMSYG